MLKEGTQVKICYHKELCPAIDDKEAIHEVTDRVIIPTRVPKPETNVKALDVTSLNIKEREQLEEAWGEYREYIANQMRTLFTFEDFIEHTSKPISSLKWRTFKSNNIQEI